MLLLITKGVIMLKLFIAVFLTLIASIASAGNLSKLQTLEHSVYKIDMMVATSEIKESKRGSITASSQEVLRTVYIKRLDGGDIEDTKLLNLWNNTETQQKTTRVEGVKVTLKREDTLKRIPTPSPKELIFEVQSIYTTELE